MIIRNLNRHRGFYTGLLIVAILITCTKITDEHHNLSVDSRVDVVLAQKHFKMATANTTAMREKGLSGTAELGPDKGMLFELSSPEEACFWMKDMSYSLDILWFNEVKQLIYAKYNATPDSYPSQFCSPSPAKYVIELKAGTANLLNLKSGDAFSRP